MTAALTAPVMAQARRRRTFAVISHPDAGKSTLTEALALHAERDRRGRRGARQGRARAGVTSDWMEMERKRGISITSAVLQFAYRDRVINLLDTPGHGDFSEDTYRVLAAVDAAVMLLDAAKGLEPQTLKLFDVCRVPRHPGAHVRQQVGPPRPRGAGAARRGGADDRPAPHAGHLAASAWPATCAACRVRDRRVRAATPAPRAAPPAARSRSCRPSRSPPRSRSPGPTAQDELALLAEIGAEFDEKDFLRGHRHPGAVRRGAAGHRRGAAAGRAGRPRARPGGPRRRRGRAAPARRAALRAWCSRCRPGMDRAHRDRMAFVRICSGRFERGMVLTHAATGRPFATKYAQSVFGQQRTTVEEAFPGDIVGLVNAGALRPGDTLYAAEPVAVPRDPQLRPRALRGRPRRRRGHASSSSAAASTSSTARASSRCCAPTCAVTRRRCSPPSARCSSRWSPTGWRRSSAPRCAWTPWATRSPGAPTRRAPSSCLQPRSRCSPPADGVLLAVFSNHGGWRRCAEVPRRHARPVAGGHRRALSERTNI